MSLYEKYLFIRAIPKTLYFNFRYLPFKEAIRLPILISHKVFLKKVKGRVTVKKPLCFGVKIGFGDVGIFDRHLSRTIWENSGHVIFDGKANIGHGSKISVSGLLEIGNDFVITAESSIICFKHVKFGDEVLISWENLITHIPHVN
ncbi:hypothetical protein, partial [Heyndrickxia coagulans]|uniref:hypothetical protein n=1 Tax=Heyndrickxia coagulans TaxID=1398 RepID=UPI003D231075